MPTLISDIVGLPGWNAPMLLLLAKATIILAIALAVTIAMQKASAGARHLVWLVAVVMLLLVPALAAWSPIRVEILPPVRAASAPTAVQVDLSVSGSGQDASHDGAVAAAPSTSVEPVAHETARGTPLVSGIDGRTLALGIWGVVVLLIAIWLAWGAFVVRRIVRNAQPLDGHDWMVPLWEIADRLELEEPPVLVASADARMPFACGFTKPVIVLPSSCEEWSSDRRSAVLLHELAHVKRRDLVGHTLGRVACALYWFHPLAWTAAKQLRNESERACDDLALACGARPSDYAEHLLDIVTSVRRDSTPAVAMAMARRREFEGRMLAILDPALTRSTPNRRQAATLAASVAMIALVVGAAAPAPRNAMEQAQSASALQESLPADFTPADVADGSAAQDVVPEAKQEARVDGGARAEAELQMSAETDVTSAIAKGAVAAATLGLAAAAQQLGSTETQTSIQRSIQSAIGNGLAAKAIDKLGMDVPPQAAGQSADERPVLLANVLRTDADPKLRRIAAWGLSEYAETSAAEEALVAALRRDADAGVREMAAWALSDARRNTATAGALVAALKSDTSERVRAIAAWSLGHLSARETTDALAAALSDPSKSVRMRALWAIGQVEPREAPQAVLTALRDSDPQVRELAAWVLFQLEDPRAVPALNAALQAETKSELQIAYIRALAATGEKSVDALRGLLQSQDPRIRTMAVRALAGGNGAGPWPWPWPEPRPFP